MNKVLTTGAVVLCGHGATFAVTSSAKLTVGHQPVLRPADVLGGALKGTCAPPGPNPVSCVTVVAVTAGQAVKLRVGGQPVVLDTLAGQTSGSVNGTPQILLSGKDPDSVLRAS